MFRRITMNKCLSAALPGITMLPLSAALAQDATAEAPIRAIIAEQVLAWNASDGMRYANHLAPDAAAFVPIRWHIEGTARDALRKQLHQRLRRRLPIAIRRAGLGLPVTGCRSAAACDGKQTAARSRT
jgi:hypothetical protein